MSPPDRPLQKRRGDRPVAQGEQPLAPTRDRHSSARFIAGTLALAALAAALLAACDDDDDYSPTTDGAQPEATQPVDGGATDDSVALPSEMGEEPIFWRTADGFSSLSVGEPYKVVFRITNGYEADTLLVTATPSGGGDPIEFEASRVEPAGPDEPGAYYTFGLELPEEGGWNVTIAAGDDSTSIPVKPSPAGG
ncbi:MAG: hypothetical protein U1B78_07120 [Dehalococcoidia bacterium]|nr:hypothetical protein [Dehalococcoidia bacterium]